MKYVQKQTILGLRPDYGPKTKTIRHTVHPDVIEFFKDNMFDKAIKGTSVNIAYERMGDRKLNYLTETGT